jgi:hypothetical protein
MKRTPLSLTRFTLIALGIAALSSAALAAPTLTVSILNITSVTKDGVKSEVLTPTKTVHPGEVLMQRAVLKTDKALVNGRVTLPLSANTRYLPGSASVLPGTVLDFSADGGKTFSLKPLKTVTVTENGKTVEKTIAVPESEYNALRWTITQTAPGSETIVSYRYQVN